MQSTRSRSWRSRKPSSKPTGRNAAQSKGPTSQAGKDRSKFNSLDHGCRAESLILPGEDAQALEERQAAWSACLLPQDDVEAYHLQDAVANSWLLDRARRAQAKRLTANILNYGVDPDQTIEKEVVELGQRLFKDRAGPLMFYPTHERALRFLSPPEHVVGRGQRR